MSSFLFGLRIAGTIVRARCLILETSLLCACLSVGIVYAQSAAPTDQPPSGWFMAGSSPGNYRAGVDKVTTQNGHPSAYLRSAVPVTGGFGTLMQTISATEYTGKRVRLHACVRARDIRDWAGMWMRVDRERTMVAFDNMQNRPIEGSEEWTAHDVVLDVPADATSISLGILLSGTGEVWMSDLRFEAVSQAVPVTSPGNSAAPQLAAHPVNLSFTE